VKRHGQSLHSIDRGSKVLPANAANTCLCCYSTVVNVPSPGLSLLSGIESNNALNGLKLFNREKVTL